MIAQCVGCRHGARIYDPWLGVSEIDCRLAGGIPCPAVNKEAYDEAMAAIEQREAEVDDDAPRC